MARFKKGESGNPKGRPKGAQDRRTQYRALLEPHASDLVAKAVEMAMGGDTTALRLCLERLVPPLRSREEPVAVPTLAGSLTDQGESILAAVGRAEITPGEAATLMGALAAQARLVEVEELEKRLEKLEEAIGQKS